MAQDITAREAAEEKVRQLDAEQRESLDCLPVAMLRVDRKGVLEMVNRAMLRLLKCKSSAELLGKNLTSEGILDSDDFQLLKRRAMRSREFRNLHIHWFTGPNLGYLLRLSGREVRDETGRLRAVEAVVEDQRVLWDAEVTAGKLNTAAEFADDFAQQLTTMLGCADLLVLHGKLEEEDRKIASTLAEAAVKARNLGERAQELFWAPRWLPRTVDLNQFAEEIEEFYRPLLDERVERVSDLAPDTGYVRADRQRLTEMTFHLRQTTCPQSPAAASAGVPTRGEAAAGEREDEEVDREHQQRGDQLAVPHAGDALPERMLEGRGGDVAGVLELRENAPPHLGRRLDGEGDGYHLLGLLHRAEEPDVALHQELGLPRAGGRLDDERAPRVEGGFAGSLVRELFGRYAQATGIL